MDTVLSLDNPAYLSAPSELADYDSKKSATSNFATKLFLGTALTSAVVSATAPVHAQAAPPSTLDTGSVTTLAFAAVTAIVSIGASMLAMAFGMLVFRIASNMIRSVMGH